MMGEDQSDDEENINIEDDGIYEVERLIQKCIVKVIITWRVIYYTCMHNISTYNILYCMKYKWATMN